MRTLQTDFTSQDYSRDPAASIEELRKSGQVIQTRFPIVGKVWITTTYDAAGKVLKDPESVTHRCLGCRTPVLGCVPVNIYKPESTNRRETRPRNEFKATVVFHAIGVEERQHETGASLAVGHWRPDVRD